MSYSSYLLLCSHEGIMAYDTDMQFLRALIKRVRRKNPDMLSHDYLHIRRKFYRGGLEQHRNARDVYNMVAG